MKTVQIFFSIIIFTTVLVLGGCFDSSGGGKSDSVGVNGSDGKDGISIVWLGESAIAPVTCDGGHINNTYYNSDNGASYICDGAGSWDLLAGTPEETLEIGDYAHGGIVFWLDESGHNGLVVSTSDLNGGTEIRWHNGSYILTNANKDGIYAGKYNTERIIAVQGAGNYAAKLCDDYTGGDYGDWYLPSNYELNLIYTNLHKNGVGAFTNNYYWSSTEDDLDNAWNQDFLDGDQASDGKYWTNKVRAVRAFIN